MFEKWIDGCNKTLKSQLSASYCFIHLPWILKKLQGYKNRTFFCMNLWLTYLCTMPSNCWLLFLVPCYLKLYLQCSGWRMKQITHDTGGCKMNIFLNSRPKVRRLFDIYLLLDHMKYVLRKSLKLYNEICSLVHCRTFFNPMRYTGIILELNANTLH